MEDDATQVTHTGLLLQGRYRLNEPLAKGMVCVVYRGEDETLRRPVAVKAVPPPHIAAYRAALEATTALAHPAAVVVFDVVDHADWLFIVQEYIAGVPLTARLAAGLAVERALHIGVQLSNVLAYAHQHGLIHGDVTPASVLVELDGAVRLNNFALPPDTAYSAHWANAEGTLVRLLGISRGAPTDSAESGTPLADVRAVGVLLWQALAQPVQTGPGSDFRADVPFVVRHLIARAIVRGHAEALTTAEDLAVALQAMATEVEAVQEEEIQPTPSLLISARASVAQNAPWSLEDTASTLAPWEIGGSIAQNAITSPGSASSPRAADAGVARTPIPSGPLRAPSVSGPLWPPAPSSAMRPSIPSTPMRPPSQSGPLSMAGGPSLPSQPRGYTPSSQPLPYRAPSATARLTSPIAWSDEPEVARWAASPSRPSWPARVRSVVGTSGGRASRRRGIDVVPVLLVGLVLFVLFFLIGYLAPLILPIP